VDGNQKSNNITFNSEILNNNLTFKTSSLRFQIVGYTTSGRFSSERGKGIGRGFISKEGFKKLLEINKKYKEKEDKNNDTLLALFRNKSSRVYHFMKITPINLELYN